MLSKSITSSLAPAVLAATLTLGVLALPALAASRHVDGTVLSKNAGDKTFRITTQSGNHVRIRVNSSTQFQRIAGGFGGLHKGLRVEVEAKTTSNGLLATHVESRRGGGGGGADDGPNHT